jgi:hypothetical protein
MIVTVLQGRAHPRYSLNLSLFSVKFKTVENLETVIDAKFKRWAEDCPKQCWQMLDNLRACHPAIEIPKKENPTI